MSIERCRFFWVTTLLLLLHWSCPIESLAPRPHSKIMTSSRGAKSSHLHVTATTTTTIQSPDEATTSKIPSGGSITSSSDGTKAKQKNQLHTGLSVSQQSTVLAHRIRTQCKTVETAMALMNQHHCSSTSSSSTDGLLDWEDAWHATLQVCGKARDFSTAIEIVQKRIPASDRCRTLAISICGRCGRIQEALELCNNHPIIQTPAPYNAAIAACGTNKRWEDALRIVQSEMPVDMVTSVTCNAVLTALAKSQRGQEAVQFLQEGFDGLHVPRDRISYHHTISALLGSGQLDQCITLVLEDMTKEAAESNRAVSPSAETYDRLIAAIVGKRTKKSGTDDNDTKLLSDYYNKVLFILQQRTEALKQQSTPLKNSKKRPHSSGADDDNDIDIAMGPPSKRPRSTSASTTTTTRMPNPCAHQWDFQKWALPKYGKGKSAYWELGTYQDPSMGTVIVGLHPNRNPAKNGIQLWFFTTATNSPSDKSNNNNDRNQRHKIGFLLMINTPHIQSDDNSIKTDHDGDDSEPKSTSRAGTSQFLGLKVTNQERRQGWAKVFVAIWLQCCIDANLLPCTGKMNKPLLCLVLQHTFGFHPVELSGGVAAKLLPAGHDKESSGAVRLTPASSAVKDLSGALTPRDIQEQHIELIASNSVQEEGRLIEVGGTLEAPTSAVELQSRIDQILRNRWTLRSDIQTASRNNNRKYSGDGVQTLAVTGSDNTSMCRLFLGV